MGWEEANKNFENPGKKIRGLQNATPNALEKGKVTTHTQSHGIRWPTKKEHSREGEGERERGTSCEGEQTDGNKYSTD